jgi:hypothetical protein
MADGLVMVHRMDLPVADIPAVVAAIITDRS